jgi:hypothetical protein
MKSRHYFRLALILLMALTAGYSFWGEWLLFAGAQLCVVGAAASPYLADRINRRRMPPISDKNIDN